jgi:hypothetical protein
MRSSLLSSKEPVKLELMAGVLGKTMVMRVENNRIPHYSATGNEKEIAMKERVGSSLLSSKELVRQRRRHGVPHYSAVEN